MNVYKKRRTMLAEKMCDNSLLVLYAGDVKEKSWDQDYPFIPSKNFYYLTGLWEHELILLISKLKGRVTETLLVRRPDPYYESYHGKMKTDVEYTAENEVDNTVYLDVFEKTISRMLMNSPFKPSFENIYFDYTARKIDKGDTFESKLTNKIVKSYPYLNIYNINREICNLRRIKSSDEIEKIQKAVDQTGAGIDNILKATKPGVNEHELEARFEFGMKMAGSDGHAFDPIIASGKNSVYLHYGDNNQDLKKGEVLLLDLGAEFEGYSADISRTYPVSGRFDDIQEKYYKIVLHAQKEVMKALKPGVDIDLTQTIAQQASYEKAKELGFNYTMEEIVECTARGICHFVGLDTHDVGDRGAVEEGMVMVAEPAIYNNELGIGIRIEDVLMITKDGCVSLSDHIPKELDEIYSVMDKYKN